MMQAKRASISLLVARMTICMPTSAAAVTMALTISSLNSSLVGIRPLETPIGRDYPSVRHADTLVFDVTLYVDLLPFFLFRCQWTIDGMRALADFLVALDDDQSSFIVLPTVSCGEI